MNTFQDQEFDEETGWVQFKWRNHQPELARFFNVDPLSESFYYNSPYAFSENKVTNHIELEGLEAYSAQAAFNQAKRDLENQLDYVDDKIQKGVNSLGEGLKNMKNSISSGLKELNKAFSEGGSGSTWTSSNFSNSEDTNRKVEKGNLDGESNMDPFIAPLLRAENGIKPLDFGIQMTLAVENETEAIESTVNKIEEYIEQKPLEKVDSVDIPNPYTVIQGGDTIEKVEIIRIPRSDL